MKMHSRLFLLLFFWIGLTPREIVELEVLPQWIIWNVGQGQWISFVDPRKQLCLHFDFGGEFSPVLKVQKTCGRFKNYALLSHADWDHRSFLLDLRRLSKLCLIPASLASIKDSQKRSHLKLLNQLQEIPLCSETVLASDIDDLIEIWKPTKKKNATTTSNDLSIILSSRDLIATGDAPMALEKTWLRQQKNKLSARWLLLGHHGSKTSTSSELLEKIKNLKITIASARRSRYGHPHAEVRQRLRQSQIPLLKTEDWGHIHLLLN